MNKNKLIILFVITLVVIIAATISAKLKAPQVSLEKELLFPDFETHINNVNSITIQDHNNSVKLELRENNWVVTNLDGYPALITKVRAALIGLSQLLIVDKKTSDPELYGELGVENIDVADSDSLLLNVIEKSGLAPIKLIIGHPRQSASNQPGIYVRLSDSSQALLVEGRLDISANPVDWINRELFDIPPQAIKRATIVTADGGEFDIHKDKKEQVDFEASDPEFGKQSSAKILINRIATGLEKMRADGVSSAGNFTFAENTINTTYETFDGIIVKVKMEQVDKKFYANFEFAYQLPEDQEVPVTTDDKTSEPSAQQLVEQMNTSLSPWVYQIPDFKYEAMTTTPENIQQLFKVPE